VPLEAPAPARGAAAGCAAAPANSDGSLDMGTSFDCFDSKANTDAPGITAEERKNPTCCAM
jgi:D-alanyl-D-alanine dipeptidase